MQSSAQTLAFGADAGTPTTEKDPKPLTAADQKAQVAKMQTSKATGKRMLLAHVHTHIGNTSIISVAITITITITNRQ